MATLLGTDTYQKQVSTNPGARPNGQLVSGEMFEFFGTYTCTGAEVTADVIPLIKLPIGAILRPGSVRISTDAVGGTSVVFSKIGDAGDDDRYTATSVALTAAGTELSLTLVNANVVAPFTIDSAANQTVLGTMTHSGAPTAGKKIVIRGLYRAS